MNVMQVAEHAAGLRGHRLVGPRREVELVHLARRHLVLFRALKTHSINSKLISVCRAKYSNT